MPSITTGSAKKVSAAHYSGHFSAPFTATRFVAVLVSALLLGGCVIKVDPDDWDYGHSYNDHHDYRDGQNIDKVFGSVDIEQGDSVGQIESVNGGITLRDSSTAEDVHVVNGSVRIHDEVSVYSVETVNGSIRAGEHLTVEKNLVTVNGSISLQNGSRVKDDVTTVNGTIRLRSTEVGNNVSTVNGDIILQSSLVSGDVVFEKNRGWFNNQEGRPKLEIDASSIVKGSVHLYRKVDLRIDENAEVGEIIEHF